MSTFSMTLGCFKIGFSKKTTLDLNFLLQMSKYKKNFKKYIRFISQLGLNFVLLLFFTIKVQFGLMEILKIILNFLRFYMKGYKLCLMSPLSPWLFCSIKLFIISTVYFHVFRKFKESCQP